MVNRRSLLGIAAAMMAGNVVPEAEGQQAAAAPVFEHDLPDVDIKNWAVTVREVNYQPGGTSAPHRHPGITIVYVLEGEIESQVGTGPVKKYGVGQMFMETPNELHAVSRNASATKPAKFLAMLLAEKGKPLTAPAK
jgi:quercetin dioxygenase-like cupin family protein